MLCELEALDMNQVRTGYPYELGAADPFAMPPTTIPPCPICSGEVSRDGPAAQALDWGVRMAEAREGESYFWKAAQVIQTYRVAEVRHSALDEQVEGASHVLAQARATVESSFSVMEVGAEEAVVAGMLGALYAWDPTQPGPNPNNPAEEQPTELEIGRSVNRLYGKLKLPPPSIESTAGGPIPENARCCVETFKYPVPTPKHRSEVQRELKPGDTYPSVKETRIWLPFRTEAVYLPPGEGESKDCYCRCCTFRQYVRLVTYREWPETSGEMGRPTTLAERREDCKWFLVSKETGKAIKHPDAARVGGGQPSDKPKDVPEGIDPDTVEWSGPWCHGRKGQGEPPTGASSPDVHSECKFETRDEPFIHVKPQLSFEWRLDFIGIIFDTCRDWVPRRTKEWQYVLQGHVGATGDFTVTNEDKDSMLKDEGEWEEWKD